MKWQQLLINIYQRMSRDFEEVLDGLTIEELHQRPAPPGLILSAGFAGMPRAAWTEQ